MKTITKLWIFIAILIILAPFGIIIPRFFKSGASWGEWVPGEIEKLVGYIPQGLARISSVWKAPMPGYLGDLGFTYMISAIEGIIIVAGIVYLIGKSLAKKD